MFAPCVTTKRIPRPAHLSSSGPGSIAGTLAASLLLGLFDVSGKYYVPAAGAFVIYALMVVLLLLFPGGLRRGAR